MKKFLLIVLAALIIFPAALTEAADVPNFYNNYLTNSERNDYTDRGFYLRSYGYGGIGENFAEQYINYLVQNYPFILTGHNAKDYTKTSAMKVDEWYFQYVGSRYVAPFQYNKRSPSCHLQVARYQYFGEGRTSFVIRISNGLTYDG